MKTILREIGLTEIETAVYLALIKHGSLLAGKISSYTGIHRRTVYDAIERLVEKGLVTYIRTNNKKHFEAVNPRRLLEIFREKEDALNAALPELEKQFHFIKEKKETVFLRGKKALQSIFNSQVESEGTVYYTGNSAILEEVFRTYIKKFDHLRKERKVKIMAVTDNEGRTAGELASMKLCSLRFNRQLEKNNTVISAFGSQLAIISWSEEPIAVLIKEKEIAECFINHFNIIWLCSRE